METCHRQREDIVHLNTSLAALSVERDSMAAELADLRYIHYCCMLTSTQTVLFQYSTLKNVEFQTLQAAHAQELSSLQMQAMESTQQLRVKWEAQCDSAKAACDALQRDIQVKTTAYEKQITGTLSQYLSSIQLVTACNFYAPYS